MRVAKQARGVAIVAAGRSVARIRDSDRVPLNLGQVTRLHLLTMVHNGAGVITRKKSVLF